QKGSKWGIDIKALSSIQSINQSIIELCIKTCPNPSCKFATLSMESEYRPKIYAAKRWGGNYFYLLKGKGFIETNLLHIFCQICNLLTIFFGHSLIDVCDFRLIKRLGKIIPCFRTIFSKTLFIICLAICVSQLFKLSEDYKTKTRVNLDYQ